MKKSKMPNPYGIAWTALLTCLRNNLPLVLWIAPIPEEDKKIMFEAGKRFIEKEKALAREPSLFNEGDLNG